jgi:hypothetical protein
MEYSKNRARVNGADATVHKFIRFLIDQESRV